MSDQVIVYVLTLEGTVLGVYDSHAEAEKTRQFGIHPTKQHTARVSQCIVRKEWGF